MPNTRWRDDEHLIDQVVAFGVNVYGHVVHDSGNQYYHLKMMVIPFMSRGALALCELPIA